MQKSRRIAAIVLAVFAGLLLVAFLGLRTYLGSDAAKHLASEKLTEKFGSDVKVTRLESGMSSTSVHIEIPGAANGPPLVSGVVEVDVSAVGLAAGRGIGAVQIDKANVNLRLDKDGNILGKLPNPKGGGGAKMPDITITGATIHLVQEGKPEFAIAGVDVQIREVDAKLAITGKVQDGEWGGWNVSGDWKADGSSGSITLDTAAPVRVTPAKLKSIPFVPYETWETVELDGMTTGKVRIGRGADAKWNWRIECAPTATKLKVFPIDLELTETAGSVVIDGAKVELAGVHGKAASGSVTMDKATLDFGQKPTRLEFHVKATDLDVKQTPASWQLSTRVPEGRMSGSGDIVLKIVEGKVQPEGKGKAKIVGKIAKGDFELRVRLVSDGQRLRFEDDPDTAQSSAPHGGDWAILQLLAATLLQPPVPQPAKPAAETQYVRANLKLRDVDIAELIAKAEVVSPVKLAGKVTLDVTAEIPTSDTNSVKLYRATGKLSTPSLQIEGLTLTDVTADVQLRDGVLKLTKFAAVFPKAGDAKAGSFLGTASVGLDPRTELKADLTLDAIPLGQVFAAIPGLKDKADGVLSGSFQLKIPADKFGALKAYEASGKLTSTELSVFGQNAEKVSAEFLLKDGVAQLTKGSAGIYGGTVSGDAKWAIVGQDPGSFHLGFKNLDAALLVKAIPDSPVKLAGKFDGRFDGTLPALEGFEASKITGDLALDSTKLIVQGIATTKLTGKLGYKTGAITYALKGDALGGSFDVEGTYPLGTDPKKPPEKPAGGTVRIERLRLDRLARDLRIDSLQPLRGIASLTLKYTIESTGPKGTGRLEIRDFGWGDDEVDSSDLVSEIRIDGDGFQIPALTGTLAGGTLRGRVQYDFDNPRKSALTLKLENADAATLLEPLGFAGASGRVSASIRTTLGKEFRGSGTITAARAKISGVDVADLRIPLSWQFSPSGNGQLTVRDAKGTIASGRVTARTEINWNGTARVEGRVEFVDVNVGELAKGFGSSSHGIGKTTGRFDFSGGEVRTVNDLKGTVTAKFGATTVKELPILGSVTALLTPVQSLSRFDSGEMTARLGAGQLRIEQLALSSAGAKLHAEGTVGLTGRLDLDVVYNTGTIGPSAPLLRTVLRDIPAIGPIPVGLIVRVTEALSNRIVRLKIDGTTANPSVRVNPAGLLTENAIRFFAGQYVPLPSK